MLNYRRLPLEGIYNIRELGGYPTPEGATRFGVFIRSACPTLSTDADKEFLKNYGVVMDLDFRTVDRDPGIEDNLANEPWLEYIRIPMDDGAAQKYTAAKNENAEEFGFTFSEHYRFIAENGKEWVKGSLEALARANGCALMHCTTGKDRTGMIAALLLAICGVSNEDIVADYSISQEYLRPFMETVKKNAPAGSEKIDDGFFKTHPENMEFLIRYLDETYGGMVPYILHCGVSQETIDTLKNKLVAN